MLRADIFRYWALKLDPWSLFRPFLPGYHPPSTLSPPPLAQRAFFGDSMPPLSPVVMNFQRRICACESLRWPLDMFSRFVDFGGVLRPIRGFADAARGRTHPALFL